MLSVVVPVYNVSDYLDDCINSILRQTYTDLQIILVDDGSTDDSGEKCDRFAERDNRIKVIHKQNGGLMSAWKAGVREAEGEYIGFVDSDDYIDSNMYSTLIQSAEKNSSDIALCGLIREYGIHTEKETFYLESGVYDRKAIEERIFPIAISNGTMLNRGLSPNRVTKIFKRELLLKNLEYCDERISLGEDMLPTFSCICDAQNVTVLADFNPYHYKIRSDSIMGSYNPNFFKQSLLLNSVLTDIANEKKVYDFKAQLTNDLLSLAYYGIERNIASKKADKKEIISYIKEMAASDEFKAALKTEALSKGSKKCRLYKLLFNAALYGLLYEFILRLVVFVRNKKIKQR